jgi:hypothetical protein
MENTEDKKNQIKDLTKTPTKKLTPEQRRNKKTSEAGGYTDINYDGIRDRDQLDLSTLDSDLQWIANIVDANDDIRQIFEASVKAGHFDPEAGQQGINNFQNAVMGSDWWQQNNQYARAAFALKTTDPASYSAAVEDARKKVASKAQAMGVPVSPEDINVLAEKVVTDGWDTSGREYKLDEAVGNYLKQTDMASQGVEPTGDLRTYANQLRNTASANGLTFSDQYYQDLAISAVRGLTNIEDAEADIREQAAGFWPSYGDKIRAGYNVRDLASGYIYTMASELEVDPQSIALDDNYIRSALTSVDEKGDARPQSLWEFQQTLRKDPRWMNTNKAQNKIADTASSVMKMFGLVG